MSDFKQKVKITIKDEFSTKLLLTRLEKKEGGLDLNEYNKAFLQVVLGAHGKEIIGYLTPDKAIAINGESYGLEEYIMIDWCFINMESIKPIGSIYFIGKIYHLVEEDTRGIYVSSEFNTDKGTIVYTIMTFDKGAVSGEIMAELDDEELGIFKCGNRKSYYAEAK